MIGRLLHEFPHPPAVRDIRRFMTRRPFLLAGNGTSYKVAAIATGDIMTARSVRERRR
jgi:hypothetical protein